MFNNYLWPATIVIQCYRSPDSVGTAKARFTSINNVQEPISILVLLIDASKHGITGRDGAIYIDKDGLLFAHISALADDVQEVGNGEFAREQVFVSVHVGDFGSGSLLQDDGNLVWVGFQNLVELLDALL